jgi:hypothetical protein
LFNRYKDGIPYPWLGGGSSFILDPVTLNQTIYSGAVRESDAGQYKCVVRNDTHNVSHTISLTVLGKLLKFAETLLSIEHLALFFTKLMCHHRSQILF